jgi:inner membrane protein
MASFGHLAVGLLAGRLQDDGHEPQLRPRRAKLALLITFGLLAMLPDADVLMVSLGVAEESVAGHRGASHSLVIALLVAIAGGLLARRYGWNGLRTGFALLLAIGSHGLLDAIGQGGRAIPLLWPLSAHRFMAPWRCLPDAPRGLRFISRHGLLDAVLEFLYFLPVTLFALWPRLAARVPRLAVVNGVTADPLAHSAPIATATEAPSAGGAAARRDAAVGVGSDRDGPSLRSIG